MSASPPSWEGRMVTFGCPPRAAQKRAALAIVLPPSAKQTCGMDGAGDVWRSGAVGFGWVRLGSVGFGGPAGGMGKIQDPARHLWRMGS